MQPLLSPQAAFARFFAHWYDPEALASRDPAGPQPALVRWCDPGTPSTDVQPLSAGDQAAVDELLQALVDAAEEDWPGLLGVERRVSEAWIEAFERHYTPQLVGEVTTRSDATEFGNEYLTLVGELGAVVARVLQTKRPALVWIYEWPYWDSGLLDPASGIRINVFALSMLRLTESAAPLNLPAELADALRTLDAPAS